MSFELPAPPLAQLAGLGDAIAAVHPGVTVVYDPANNKLRVDAPAALSAAIARTILDHQPPAPRQPAGDRIRAARNLDELKTAIADHLEGRG